VRAIELPDPVAQEHSERVLTRAERVLGPLTRDMRLIEVGASYSPIAPKAAGWKTTVVDHAPRRELIAKYSALGVDTAAIEEVDFIWQQGGMEEAIPPELYGSFGGLIASHVVEHLPDLISFFQSAERLLSPAGVIALALPDKRLCFDFFQPLSLTGDLLAAHAEHRVRHSRETAFNYVAYRMDTVGLVKGRSVDINGKTINLNLEHPLGSALQAFNVADESPSSPYQDSHCWFFTPSSFELVILELEHLGLISWEVSRIESASSLEFYAWLSRTQPSSRERGAAVNDARLRLLRTMLLEAKEQADAISIPMRTRSEASDSLLSGPASARIEVGGTPTISAIIPLFNGGRYIEATLRSVFSQTLLPNEIIVVDDGSTDNGTAIVERLSEKHKITLLRKQNGGQSSARNLGVSRCSGELIALLDHDDVWYPTHLEELVKPFWEHRSGSPLGWVYSNLDEINEVGQMVCRSFLTSLPARHPKRSLIDCLRTDMYVLPSASLISRTAFDEVGGFDEQLCGYEDDDLFLRLFRAGYDSVFLDSALSQWRIHPKSASYTERMVRSRETYARKLFDQFPDDWERARYYSRDFLVPRFFPAALQEWRKAIIAGDDAWIRRAWLEANYMAPLMGRGQGLRVGATLRLLRSPQVAKAIFRVRNLVRPLMLRALRS
jgi:glycosyltransferase involved in cell wall biosynthesis